ncbi:MAG: VOC family protein [Pseudomonadota bacterium]
MTAQGSFIWYELLTSDVDAAVTFYGKVIGWQLKAHAFVPGYHLFASKDADIGGMMAMATDAGITRPVWLGYIAVGDVDATVAAAVKDGATVCVPPTSIPGVGRFSMIRDPQGVATYVMRGEVEGGVSRSFAPLVGHCQWNELVTIDPAAAVSFYTRLVGWQKGDVMPMGPLGDYQFLTSGTDRIGAIMKRSREDSPPIWRFYFGVDDIDRAAKAITDGGGRLLADLQPVPGGGFAAVAVDPQGAEFGVAGPRKAQRP